MKVSELEGAKRVSRTMDIVITDFGNVKISKRSLAWLRSLDPNWREISTSKRKRSKHAQYVRYQVCRFETAVMVAATIAWHSQEELHEF